MDGCLWRQNVFQPRYPCRQRPPQDVVGELVDNYTLDGIHIDDYFLPLSRQGHPFLDSTTFRFYGQPFNDINDWRRSNTDKLVEALYNRIKDTSPNIQFGVSPFGVWRKKAPTHSGGLIPVRV
ncbi:MAG: family 10 glycosylhydrolase [Saprospiraceae bacterium]